MSNKSDIKAVIYCRVSDPKQKTHGDGLNSQQTRCREYANYKRYTVVDVFMDDMTGAVMDRPGMKAMLAYVRKHRRDPHIVIIDDISRLARSLETHLQLRAAISSAGGLLESPSIEFGEDSDSILVENLLASVSQHHRQKNCEQTKNRMRARVMNGYWVFKPPVGYRFEQVAGHNKLLVRDEPLASIIQEALEGYASRRFELQAEVKRFLESHPTYPRASNGEVLNQRVTDILTCFLYAGYVSAPDWDVSLRKGHHEALISFETFLKIQERLKGHAKTPARKNLNLDFPLRGAVVCGDCDTPLTACWSSGRSARYAYYLCPKKGCESYGKSIRRETIEGEFEDLLHKLTPNGNLLQAGYAMFEKIWNHRFSTGEVRTRELRAELAKIQRQSEQLLDKIADVEIPSVVTALAERMHKLTEKKLVIEEKIANGIRPARSFDQSLRTALDFLANPCKLWVSESIEAKRAVLKLAFADRLSYVRNSGFRTADLTLPFKALADFSAGKNKMASPRGFEPRLPP